MYDECLYCVFALFNPGGVFNSCSLLPDQNPSGKDFLSFNSVCPARLRQGG